MRMHGMCLLNMNDAHTGGVGGLTQQSDCHSCQAAPSAPEAGVTAGSDNMVCNLALLQGTHPHHQGHLQQSNLCHPCGSQIAFLPIRISPDRGIEPLVIGTSGTDFPNLHLSSSSSAPLLSLSGGHCPCCPFHSYDSGFSDSLCDSCANGSSTIDGKVPNTTTSTPLIQKGATSPASTLLKNNDHRLQQLHLDQQQYHHGCGSLLTVPEKASRCDSMAGGPCHSGQGHGQCNNITSQCYQIQHHHHHQHHRHHHHNQHSSLNTGCRQSALSNQSLLNIRALTQQQQQQQQNQHIPRVILKSPADSDEPSIQLVDQQVPHSSDSSSSSSLLRPELLHSRSLQDYENDGHQERCQMAGGHLMQQGFPTHRHSTGNTYENIHLINELNIRAMPGNSWGGIVSCNSSSSGSRSSQQGSCSPQVESMSPLLQAPGAGSLEESSGSNKGQELSSGQGQTLGSSCPSWPDEDFGDLDRPGSPSSSGSEDSSGSSVASWAQNFTGAAENELHWKTLKASRKRLDECGFYYEHMSMEQARIRLRETKVGSFLLRDSSHKRFLFSLSAKTPRGVTSVRIEYRNAQFKLDCEEKSQSQTPAFDCVLKLIQYYVELSESKPKNKCVWLESSGRKDTPVLLLKPVLRSIQSLSHMCRKVIHKHIDMQRLEPHLKTDFTNLQYLREYPFNV